MDDDTDEEGVESTEKPLIEDETATPMEEANVVSDVDEDTEYEQSDDEEVLEPRSFSDSPGEDAGDDQIVIEAKDDSLDDQVVIEAEDSFGGQVSYGVPPSSFWLWNGAPVFNPFVDNALEREEAEGADSDESEVADPVQQAREAKKLIALM